MTFQRHPATPASQSEFEAEAGICSLRLTSPPGPIRGFGSSSTLPKATSPPKLTIVLGHPSAPIKQNVVSTASCQCCSVPLLPFGAATVAATSRILKSASTTAFSSVLPVSVAGCRNSHAVGLEAVMADLERAETCLLDLRRVRADKVAELTRLSEHLSANRSNKAVSDQQAWEVEQTITIAMGKRKRAADGLAIAKVRIAELNMLQAQLQNTSPEEPQAGEPLEAEAVAMAEGVSSLEKELKSNEERFRSLSAEGAELERRLGAVAEVTVEARRDVGVLRHVYEKADRYLSMVDPGKASKMECSPDPVESAVFALVRTVLPQANFSCAGEAVRFLKARVEELYAQPISLFRDQPGCCRVTDLPTFPNPASNRTLATTQFTILSPSAPAFAT